MRGRRLLGGASRLCADSVGVRLGCRLLGGCLSARRLLGGCVVFRAGRLLGGAWMLRAGRLLGGCLAASLFRTDSLVGVLVVSS